VRIFVQGECNESWLSIAEPQPKMGFSPKGVQERGSRKIVQGECRTKQTCLLCSAEPQPMFVEQRGEYFLRRQKVYPLSVLAEHDA
jgi:hypothetical protein